MKQQLTLLLSMAVGSAMAQEFTTDFLEEQPEGTVQYFMRAGNTAFAVGDTYLTGQQNGSVQRIVTAADGETLYIQNPVCEDRFGTWVKASLQADGKIHLPLFQCIYNGIGIGVLNLEGTTFVPDFTITEVTFTTDPATGIMTLDGIDDSHILGTIDTQTLQWYGGGDMASTLYPMDMQYSTIPADLECQDWTFFYTKNIFGEESRDVKIAVQDDQFYIAGLQPYAPDAAIVGTLADGLVTFGNDQYLGIDTDYDVFVFFCPAHAVRNEMYSALLGMDIFTFEHQSQLVMSYDADNRQLTNIDNGGIILNCGAYDLMGDYSLDELAAVQFSGYLDVPAVPADPVIVDFTPFDETTELYNWITLDLPKHDVNGHYIAPKHLSYMLWGSFNGQTEPYIFSNDAYLIDEDMIRLPYDFTATDITGQEQAIQAAGRNILLYDPSFDNIGVQVFCTAGGEEHASNIVWAMDNQQAIRDIEASATATQFYSISGQKLPSLSAGIGLVRTADGKLHKVHVR